MELASDSHLLSACLEAVIMLYSTGICGGMGAALYMLFLIGLSISRFKETGMHGLESNPGSSLQTEEEAGLP